MSGVLFTFRSPKPPVDPREAAEWWLARRSLGQLGARDEALFEDWLTRPANAASYALVESAFAGTGAYAAEPEILQLRAEALRQGPRLRAPGCRLGGGMAAVFLLGVTLALMSHGSRPTYDHGLAQTANPSHSGSKRYETRIGERQRVRLDDGSVVFLNTGALIEVAYRKNRRDVRLLRGQALFQVAHNAAWPFVVTAADREVTAVGTAFDVRLDGSAVSVVLLEGKVRVEPLRRTGLERLLPHLADEMLVPGERLVAREGVSQVKVAAADVERATSWTQGQLIFRDDSLSAAVAELNRYSESRILVVDTRVAALKVSGVFSTGRPHNFISAVTAFYPVDARQSSPGVTELAWREPR